MTFNWNRQVFRILFSLTVFAASLGAAGVTYTGTHGPGLGKHIVLLAGDDGEYHSEEALPALAKILAVRHGFTCTVSVFDQSRTTAPSTLARSATSPASKPWSTPTYSSSFSGGKIFRTIR